MVITFPTELCWLGSLIFGLLDSPAFPCTDMVFCWGGGGGGRGGVSHSTVLLLGRSVLPGKVSDGICSLCCWLVGGLIPKSCSPMLWNLERCGLVDGRCAAAKGASNAAAAAVATAKSAACCS